MDANFFPEEEMEFRPGKFYYNENGELIDENEKERMKEERSKQLKIKTPSKPLRELYQFIHEIEKNLNLSGMNHITEVVNPLVDSPLGKIIIETIKNIFK